MKFQISNFEVPVSTLIQNSAQMSRYFYTVTYPLK